MSHFSGSSGGNGGYHGEGGNLFHYAVGDNYNPLGSYSDIYKLEHLTEGLRINNGIRFAILFIAFAGWLYIVYWLRHHEPLLRQSIGMNAAAAPTANQDKSIVASIKNAFPLKTSAEFGSIYVPSPQPVSNTPPSSDLPNKKSQNKSPNLTKVNAGEAISAPETYVDQDFDQRFGSPANPQFPLSPSAVAEPILSNPTRTNSPHQTNSTPPDIKSLYTSYSVPVQNGSTTSLRTIVNR